MNFVEPIRDTEKVKHIGDYLKEQNEKFYIMYSIGIYSGLRISDILSLKVRDVKGKTALIFDDEVSTAGTLVEAANILKEHGAKEIYAGATHAVL